MSEFPKSYFEQENYADDAFELALYTLQMSIAEYNSLTIDDFTSRKNINEYAECLALNILIKKKKELGFTKPKLCKDKPFYMKPKQLFGDDDDFNPYGMEFDEIPYPYEDIEKILSKK